MQDETRSFLDEKVRQYNERSFIESDPICVPHRFDQKEDIEIAAFLTASIAWGQRSTIIKNANRLMDLMPGGPHHFVCSADDIDLERFTGFAHRTFNSLDCNYFVKSLQRIYLDYGGLEAVFTEAFKRKASVFDALVYFRKVFLEAQEAGRTAKHVSDVSRGSAAKRLNMFLRWMVRSDAKVDFGLWRDIPMSALYLPLDVHSGNVARKLGLLERKQNDWKAVEEVTDNLRDFDPDDPVKYDFALFGLGVFEKF